MFNTIICSLTNKDQKTDWQENENNNRIVIPSTRTSDTYSSNASQSSPAPL